MESAHPWIRTRLSAMFFLTFFIYACWMVPMASYMGRALQLMPADIGWVYSAAAIAAIVSPLFVGYVADRLFATERILAVLHLVGGLALIAGSQQSKFPGLMACMMLHTLCFMPSLALGNSLTFRNIPDAALFPRIAMFGTIGWIVSGWIVGLVLGETKNWFFFLGGGAELLLAAYCLTLPHTPPKAREAAGDVLGLKTVALLKDPAFLFFILCAFLVSIPATSYFVFINPYLMETGWFAPATLMTLGQFTEIFVMFTMSWFIAWLGLRWILLLGMAVWALRFALFASLNYPLALLGVLVHGFGYCFVYVGSYIYVDKNAPQELRASAQSFISFLMLGVGWFIGSQLSGVVMNSYPAPIATITAVDREGKTVESALPRWDVRADAPFDIRLLFGYLSQAVAGKSAERKNDLGALLDRDGDGRLSAEERNAIPAEGLKIDDKTYTQEELSKLFQRIAQWKVERKLASSTDEPITRDDWLAVQARGWPSIWLWPTVAAAVVGILFLVSPRGKRQSETPEQESSP